MSNSSLISGKMLSPNCTCPRNHKITRITPHFMEWYIDARTCCESFMPTSRRASANYCIGKDGEIWLNVEECNMAWTSGSAYNDNRAVTIECANYMGTKNYGVLPDATWDSLVKLCVDICKRNSIERLIFTGDDSGNLTMHKYYQDTNCPGPWLSGQFDRLAREVNDLLGQPSPEPKPFVFGGIYKCKVNGLNVRTEPSLSGKVVAQYYMGSTILLDDWYTSNDGYIWGRYTGSTSGQKRYIAVGKDTGFIDPNDYLVKLNL